MMPYYYQTAVANAFKRCGGALWTSIASASLRTSATSNRRTSPDSSSTGGFSKCQTLVEDMSEKFRKGRSHEVSIYDLFQVWKQCHDKKDYQVGLSAMNAMYNFGKQLDHFETSNRLLALCMCCGKPAEAVQLIKLFSSWLKHPPEVSTIYSVMEHFYDEKDYETVRNIMQAIRENWQIPLGSRAYVITMEAMLQLKQNALQEAMVVYDDSEKMGVTLPVHTQVQLLEELLKRFENIRISEGAATTAGDASNESRTSTEGKSVEVETTSQLLDMALRVKRRLLEENHNGSAALPSSAMLALGWLKWRTDPTTKSKAVGQRVWDPDWVALVTSACERQGLQWGFSFRPNSSFIRALKYASEQEGCEKSRKVLELLRVAFSLHHIDIVRP